MTELFEPSQSEQRKQAAEKQEEEAFPNFIVQLFFFVAFAGGVSLLVRWASPGQGKSTYLVILAASYYSTWLFNRFLRRD